MQRKEMFMEGGKKSNINKRVSLFIREMRVRHNVRNHVKLMRVINSCRGFSKGTVLCGGY